ncbi:hypothetical protein ElyMa_003509600 [Elysia marginata]|uniref:Uncharacterized protein n=1 Tax=Elysia marginata TaxID=1093978 RepID=A0AAV4EGD1_9GAST|nr:hypothetical protein ElyMa_003509600 [Elysia marginata]
MALLCRLEAGWRGYRVTYVTVGPKGGNPNQGKGSDSGGDSCCYRVMSPERFRVETDSVGDKLGLGLRAVKCGQQLALKPLAADGQRASLGNGHRSLLRVQLELGVDEAVKERTFLYCGRAVC